MGGCTARFALIRHDALIESVIAEHHGSIVRPRGEGDSRFAVFAHPSDAVAAAAATAQAGLPTSEQRGLLIRAVRLFAASDYVREAKGAPMWPAERADYERNLERVRALVDKETWHKEWDAGLAMTAEKAIAYARFDS